MSSCCCCFYCCSFHQGANTRHASISLAAPFIFPQRVRMAQIECISSCLLAQFAVALALSCQLLAATASVANGQTGLPAAATVAVDPPSHLQPHSVHIPLWALIAIIADCDGNCIAPACSSSPFLNSRFSLPLYSLVSSVSCFSFPFFAFSPFVLRLNCSFLWHCN